MTPLEVRSKLEDTTLFDLNAPKGPEGSQAVRLSAAELKEELAEGIDEINLAFVDGKLLVTAGKDKKSVLIWEIKGV